MPVNIHGKSYVMVNERVVEAHNEYKDRVSISTEIDTEQEGIVRAKATVKIYHFVDGAISHQTEYNGHAEEIVGSSMINKTSALENAETSAVGRALAFAGFSADASIASAEEVFNAINQQQSTPTPLPSKSKPKTPKPNSKKFDIEDVKAEVESSEEENWGSFRKNKVNFGKHKEDTWEEVPDGYLAWMAGSSKPSRNTERAKLELEYRENNVWKEEKVEEVSVSTDEELKDLISTNTEELFD